MKTPHSLKVVLAALTLGVTHLSAATLMVLPDSASPYLTTPQGFPPGITLPQDGGSGVANVGGSSLESANPNTQLGNAVFVFQLPSLGATANPFSTASFTITLASTSGGAAYGFNPFNNNYDLYGLGARASSTVLSSDFYAGGGDVTDATLLQAKIAGTSTPSAGTAFTISDPSVLAYLNTQYAAGAGAGQYVFLRVNPNFNPSSFSDQSWAADSSTFVTYTAVPEPGTWLLLLAGFTLLPLSRRRWRRAEFN